MQLFPYLVNPIFFFSASGVIKTPAQLLLNYLISFSFSCTAEAGREL
jgi:hypothetical protein